MNNQQIVTTKHRTSPTALLWVTLGVALIAATAHAGESAQSGGFSLDTAFIYQGALKQNGGAADGLYDFQYEIYDQADGGIFLGTTTLFDQIVANGAFSSELDFQRNTGGGGMWLEIKVREAGNGVFSTLSPRQLLSSGGGVCTVDSDLEVNGTVAINAPNSTRNVYIDGDKRSIQARTLTTFPTVLELNPLGGSVRINDSESDFGRLIIEGETDVSLAESDGMLIIGKFDGPNLGIDRNEIMARNNTEPRTLFLNHEGGLVQVGPGGLNVVGDLSVGGTLNVGGPLNVNGLIDIGFQIVTIKKGDGVKLVSAPCPSGKKVIAGGCYTSDPSNLFGADKLVWSYPSLELGTWSWICLYDDEGHDYIRAHAICANIN